MLQTTLGGKLSDPLHDQRLLDRLSPILVKEALALVNVISAGERLLQKNLISVIILGMQLKTYYKVITKQANECPSFSLASR